MTKTKSTEQTAVRGQNVRKTTKPRKTNEKFSITIMAKSFGGGWKLGYAWVDVSVFGAVSDGLALYAKHDCKELRRVVGGVKEAMMWFQSNRIPSKIAGKLMAYAIDDPKAPRSWQPNLIQS